MRVIHHGSHAHVVWSKGIAEIPTIPAHILDLASKFQRPPNCYALTVLLTTRCNLACNYCFQNTASGSPLTPSRIPGHAITEDVIDHMVRFAGQRMREGGFREVSAVLFGGEPLLEYKAAEALLFRLQSLNLVSATLVTNGVLMTPERLEGLVAKGLRQVQITLDGDREHHDAVRVWRGSGAGTFSTILDNLRYCCEVFDVDFMVRVNTRLDNLSTLNRLIDQLAETLPRERVHIYFAPLETSSVWAGAPMTSERLAEQLEDLYVRAVVSGLVPVVSPSPHGKQCVFCSRMWGKLGNVISADGDLYSCWDSAGQVGYRVGDVVDGYSQTAECAKRWVQCGYQNPCHDAESQAWDEVMRRVEPVVLHALQDLHEPNSVNAGTDKAVSCDGCA